MLTQNNFKCKQCGECCRPIVGLKKEDIKRIKTLGLKKKEFAVYDKEIKMYTLKQINNVCMFLRRQRDKFTCKIYDQRPDICRKYPFVPIKENASDCKPKNSKYWMDLKGLVKET